MEVIKAWLVLIIALLIFGLTGLLVQYVRKR